MVSKGLDNIADYVGHTLLFNRALSYWIDECVYFSEEYPHFQDFSNKWGDILHSFLPELEDRLLPLGPMLEMMYFRASMLKYLAIKKRQDDYEWEYKFHDHENIINDATRDILKKNKNIINPISLEYLICHLDDSCSCYWVNDSPFILKCILELYRREDLPPIPTLEGFTYYHNSCTEPPFTDYIIKDKMRNVLKYIIINLKMKIDTGYIEVDGPIEDILKKEKIKRKAIEKYISSLKE